MLAKVDFDLSQHWTTWILTAHRSFTGTSSDLLEDLLFEDVLDLSKDRILQRLRPRWIDTPRYYTDKEEPLWERIDRMLRRIKFSTVSTPYDDILSRLEAFTSSARGLKHRLEGARLHETIKSIVRSCAEISYSGEHRSLEQQVALRGGSGFVTKDILQIDKLARYFGLCRDLGKLSQRCNFHNTTKRITLHYLAAFPAERPRGALKTCYVHAEVQLILYYEQHSTERPPRAIGCSKSACFLCDILIQKSRKYWISQSHKRLYNQWTIKDVCWMTEEQVLYFRDILQAITAEISSLGHELEGPFKRQLPFKKFGLESRAVLPLSSNSSLGGPPGKSIQPRSESVASRNSSSTIAKSRSTAVRSNAALKPQKAVASTRDFTLMHPAATSSCLSLPAMLEISGKDLPHRQKLESKAETCVYIGKLLLIFDCSTSSAGSLSIRKVEADDIKDGKNAVRRIRVADIPITPMFLPSGGSSKMVFRLKTGHTEVEVEIIWH